MDEPMLRVWMQEPVPPKPCYEQRPGRWAAEEAWPSPRLIPWELALNDCRLDETPEEERTLTLSSPLTTGSAAGRWCSFGQDPDLPTDQRGDDGGSLIFDTLPLPERIELLGTPEARLELAVDRPQAMVAVRLCAVAPDGSSRRLCYGLLNLSHRNGHDRPEPMRPGRRVRVAVPLGVLGEALPAGHRLRLAVSTSYWPIAWPSPEPVRLTLYTGASRLVLSLRPPAAADGQLRPFEGPESTPAALATTLQEGRSFSTVEHDLASGRRRMRLDYDYGIERIEPHGLETAEVSTETLEIGEGDPNRAEAAARYRIALGRGPWRVRVETMLRLSSDPKGFRLQARLDAFEGEDRLFARDWVASIPRDHL
jgi:hypothetical protein